MSKINKVMASMLPGPLKTVTERFGFGSVVKLLAVMGGGYLKDALWLMSRGHFREGLNFLYVKAFVPTGEGAGAAAYILGGNRLIYKYPQLAPYPRYIEVEVTTVCNKKCIMCEHTHWKPGEQEKRHLSLDEFKKIVSNFPDLKWINATGEGSAFLNKDYIEMLQYLSERNTSVYFVDHLEEISDDVIERLVKMRVKGIYISFDAATKETYEKIKVGCDFDRVISNLEKLFWVKKRLKSPFPEINYRFVLNSLNIKESPDFLDIVNRLGGRKTHGFSSRIDYCGLLGFPGIKQYEPGPIPDEVTNSIHEKARKYNLFVTISHAEAANNPPIHKCLGWMEPYIMMGGYCQPCCGVMMSNKRPWLRERAFGNINEQSFEEIWNSERYREFRRHVNNPRLPAPRYCSDCRAYSARERVEKYGVAEDL